MSKLRQRFTDEEIKGAYYDGSIKQAGERLSALGRGQVSRQLAKHWLVELKLHKPSKRKHFHQDGPKVGLLDIETSPITGYVWSLWKQNVGLNQIKEEWNILSFCFKELGSAEIEYDDLRPEGDHFDPLDDSKLVQRLWEICNEYDILIAQNGKRFDVPKIQARFVLAGLPPPRPFKVIDTLLMARQQFNFTSNKLEWMTDKLCTTKKEKHKNFPGFELWSECLKGNPLAWDEMKEYNIPDVTSMEELYLILRPWYVGHPNVAVYTDSSKVACPKCGSHDIKQDGWVFTQVGKYESMHCGGCGGWSRGRYTRNKTDVRKSLLSN